MFQQVCGTEYPPAGTVAFDRHTVAPLMFLHGVESRHVDPVRVQEAQADCSITMIDNTKNKKMRLMVSISFSKLRQPVVQRGVVDFLCKDLPFWLEVVAWSRTD